MANQNEDDNDFPFDDDVDDVDDDYHDEDEHLVVSKDSYSGPSARLSPRVLQPTPLPPRHGQLHVSFSHYRELQACSSSASTRTSSDTTQHRRVHSARPNSPFAQRMLYQAPASPSRSRVPPSSSCDLANVSPFPAPDTALPAANSFEQRRRDVRDSHSAPDRCTIPKPEQCDDAPPSQRLLAKVPRPKSSRKSSTLGHFYNSYLDTEFQCQVVNDSGDICEQRCKSGGGKARTNHITNQHSALDDAFHEFRTYQCMAQGIELPQEQEDDEIPFTPKNSRFETAWDELFLRT
ncbi:hypothetical protein BC939DRAFT_472419 [Gamsiella multidivaricata]|uniref:uncharacterized protein n=1 Tax=Gamsiella multidivaricata TaxID=101098 RepID=UPI00221ED68A|nr:uncharacterized protein BC939DRAFT_472419 [Gamsiella multidivaricata]KAI7832848.1 hypothetical protein BC939DRAFT_472419 [Gamsiella multidivaricata]